MTTRRNFLKAGGLMLTGLATARQPFFSAAERFENGSAANLGAMQQYVCQRPPVGKRQFTSKTEEKNALSLDVATLLVNLWPCS